MPEFLEVNHGLAAVTDLGRPGLAHDGIPANGAADQFSAAAANILVGNREDAPLIEITASACSFTPSCPALIAVTGAPATLTGGAHLHPRWEPVCVPAGGPVTVSDIHHGMRCYVAVRGTLSAPRMLGSCAPDPLLGFGTWLRAGSRVGLDSSYAPFDHPAFHHPLFRLAAPVPRFGTTWTVDVTDGPDAADFADLERTLFASPYQVGTASNHVGLRLLGPAPSRLSSGELLSRGVPVGAVEVTPSAQLIVLLRGRPVTAGYPVIAVATRVAQQALGQAAPGHHLVFRRSSRAAAVAGFRARRHALDELASRVRTVFAATGLDTNHPPHVPTPRRCCPGGAREADGGEYGHAAYVEEVSTANITVSED